MADFLHWAQLIPFVMRCGWQSKPSNLVSNCLEFSLFFPFLFSKYLQRLQGESLDLIYWVQCSGNQVLSAGLDYTMELASWLSLPVSFYNVWVKMFFLVVPLEAVYCGLLELHLIFLFRTFPELDLLTGYSCRLHFHTSKHSLRTVKHITLSVASSFFLWFCYFERRSVVCAFSPLVLLFTMSRCCRKEKAKFMCFRLPNYPSVPAQCVSSVMLSTCI